MWESEVHTATMTSPDDVSGVAALFARGIVDPAHVVAIIAQTEGDGHARGYCALMLRLLFADHLRISEPEVFDRIPMLMIGGVAGLMTPHLTIFVRKPPTAAAAPTGRRLSVGVASTRKLLPEEYGTVVQAHLVADAVREAMAQAGTSDPADVACVELKCAQLTPSRMADAASRKATLASSDPRLSSQLCRGAAALGAAIALGEVAADDFDQEAIARRPDLYTLKGSASSGTEQDCVRVLLLANVKGAPGRFVAGAGVMTHQLDLPGAQQAFINAGLKLDQGILAAADRPKFVTAFVNAGADTTTQTLGLRHTMKTDLMAHYTGHMAKALAHAAVAGIAQNALVLGNAGAEHQGPPGSNLVCVIARAE